jgi:hypothetical protein
MHIYNPGTRITQAYPLGNEFIVIERTPSNMVLGNGVSVPDTVVKKIYGIGSKGEMVLKDTITGTVTPAQTIPDSISFPV